MHFNKQDINRRRVVGKCYIELYKQHAVPYIKLVIFTDICRTSSVLFQIWQKNGLAMWRPM